jgi:hypothetical protein
MVLKNVVRIRYRFIPYLILLFFLPGCFPKRSDDPSGISIQWKDSVATGLIIPKSLVSGLEKESIRSTLTVRLKQATPQPPVFGEYLMAGDEIVFQPLVPLTRGLSYEIFFRDSSLATIIIPFSGSENVPEVLAVYPSQDTLPENLLKFYVSFSKPMREGGELEHIVLIEDEEDTLASVFMDLQPALWNNAGTLLTLWLDPGRIKRELLPNQKMGPPLAAGQHYTLIINDTWRAMDGGELKTSFSKTFVAGPRDNNSPEPLSWTVGAPPSGTTEPLKIRLHESLDYVLLEEAIDIYNEDDKIVRGEWNITEDETMLSFNPAEKWFSGSYYVSIETRLEDLAGNNPNRLFDRDITKSKATPEKEQDEIPFVIK